MSVDETLNCWRVNYGLDKSPHGLMDFWQNSPPVGAVLALKCAVEMIERYREWLEGEANCPCCDKFDACVEGCTFEDDAPHEAERMAEIRDLLYRMPDEEKPPK